VNPHEQIAHPLAMRKPLLYLSANLGDEDNPLCDRKFLLIQSLSILIEGDREDICRKVH
jgi:hypothetical protein